MPPAVFSTTSLVELEQFMLQVLCDHEKLDPTQVIVKRTAMRQGVHVIGRVLRVAGTRQMKSHAIWAERENRVLFYDSAGHRFAEVRLADAPDLQQYPQAA